MRPTTTLLAAFVLLTCLAAPVQAAITVVAHYRMGEADVGAQAGQPGASSTQDSAGGPPLTRVGAPVYSGEGRPIGGSILSMSFNGSSDRYIGSVVPVSNTQFGIEAWVRSRGSVAGNSSLAYNGNTGSSGWGLFRLGAQWGFLYGGVQLGTSPQAVSTEWTHLALVRDGGTASFYVNGQSVATSNNAPNPPAGNFLVGGNPLVGTEFFDGEIDEVRVFTFAPGAFQVSDLNLIGPSAYTEIPSSSRWSLLALLLAIAGIAGFALLQRR